jgi:iron only hydrogenase large subunit-like protein
MIKAFEIDWKSLSDGHFDSLFGESSGANAIFGVTGGLMKLLFDLN